VAENHSTVWQTVSSTRWQCLPKRCPPRVKCIGPRCRRRRQASIYFGARFRFGNETAKVAARPPHGEQRPRDPLGAFCDTTRCHAMPIWQHCWDCAHEKKRARSCALEHPETGHPRSGVHCPCRSAGQGCNIREGVRRNQGALRRLRSRADRLNQGLQSRSQVWWNDDRGGQ
jgi:hypothetical protein